VLYKQQKKCEGSPRRKVTGVLFLHLFKGAKKHKYLPLILTIEAFFIKTPPELPQIKFQDCPAQSNVESFY